MPNETADTISLNFFPITPDTFSFPIYRLPWHATDGEKYRDDREVGRYCLSKHEDFATKQREEHWVACDRREGFSRHLCDSEVNFQLTKRYLFGLLLRRASANLQASDFFVGRGLERKLYFVLANFPEGRQTVWLSPYYLQVEKRFGFLADFHFVRTEGVHSSRRTLQLSLSLDQNGRENTASYSDRRKKLSAFLTTFFPFITSLSTGDSEEGSPLLSVDPNLVRLRRLHLGSKSFVVGSGKVSAGQFQGVKLYGPLIPASEQGLICFVYKPEHKPLSHELYRALNGDLFPTFPGMKKMFGVTLDKDHVQGLPIESHEPEAIAQAIPRLAAIGEGRPVVPIVLVPWSRHDGQDASDGYHRIKHVFLSKNLPSQFVSLGLLGDKQSFKWSISNIGLGVFSKLGGKPWKVTPRHDHCLIIGIGKSHKFDEDGHISRYFAYSVLTDSSGLYEDLQVLSHSTNEEQYLGALKDSLLAILRTNAKTYKKFTIHTTFALRWRELKALDDALTVFSSEISEKDRLVAMKFNDDSSLFGYAEQNNSMIPFEGSYIRVANNDYLLWFEGLQFQNPNVKRRIARPVQVQFIYPKDGSVSRETQKGYLQDAMNLSGANWRGFNAKTLPISVYYAQLLSRYFGEFDRLNLALPPLEHMTPWFL